MGHFQHGFNRGGTLMNIRRKRISEIVRRILSQGSITQAPVDVEHLARLQNAVVHVSVAEDKFAGFLFRDAPGGLAIIGVNSKHSKTRQRFTIAHEIGHLLLHAPSSEEAVHFDEVFMRRDPRSTDGTDPNEIEANQFAAELLMPESFIDTDLEIAMRSLLSEEELIEHMAHKYKVSPQAMGIRLSFLGYL